MMSLLSIYKLDSNGIQRDILGFQVKMITGISPQENKQRWQVTPIKYLLCARVSIQGFCII